MIRSDQQELMDDPNQDVALLRDNLVELERVNRLLSGNAMTIRCLKDFVEDGPGKQKRPARISLLDICCGGADLSRKMADWLVSRGITTEVVAADMSPTIVNLARERSPEDRSYEIRYETADARALSYEEDQFDLVNISLALHHFPPAEAARVLSELRRVASKGVIVNDLSRTRTCLAAAHLVKYTIASGSLSRHDGPISVKRSYLPTEARQLAQDAGFAQVRVRRMMNCRYSLSCWV